MLKGDFTVYNNEEYIALIKSRLSDYRFYHSVCVSESAKALAKKYGADENKAELAGILHDVMKEASAEEQLDVIEKAGWSLAPYEKNQPKFFHQLSGAAYIKSVLKIDDEEIINAVRYHTTGRAGMSLMEEIIYLADFISADRNYKDVDVMRKMTEKSKEDGMIYAMGYTINRVVKNQNFLHPETVNAYNYMINKFSKEERV